MTLRLVDCQKQKQHYLGYRRNVVSRKTLGELVEERLDDIKTIEAENPDFKFEHRFRGFPLNTVQTDKIFCVVSQQEMTHVYPESDNDCLISITCPDRPNLDKEISGRFKTVLETKFFDVTAHDEQTYDLPLCGGVKMCAIPHEEAQRVKEFILANRDKRFAVHCAAGVSRSAAVAEAIICLLDYNGDVYQFRTGDNPIKKHWRYYPNKTVFDRIMFDGVWAEQPTSTGKFIKRESDK